MRPDPDKVLMGVAMAVMAELPPEIRTPFGQSKAQMGGMLLLVLAQESDRLVERLNKENEAVAAILFDAARLLSQELAMRVKEAIRGRVLPDLRVSTLVGINDRLRGLLIDVHAVVERLTSPEAAIINARIWAELVESTRRRHVEVPR